VQVRSIELPVSWATKSRASAVVGSLVFQVLEAGLCFIENRLC